VLSAQRLFQIFSWLVVACLCAATAYAVTLKARRILGGEYVAINDLASFYNLGRNTSREKESAAYSALWLDADRRDVNLGGVIHWLNAPVVSVQDRLWISATDVLKTIDPVLRQGRLRAPVSVRTIVLDPGHGGNDRGTRGHIGIEKTLVFDLVQRVKDQLDAAGFRVWLTRTSDRTLTLDDRTDYAAAKRADLFISIHLNSGGNAEGIETYCLTPAGAVSTATPFRSWQASRDQETETGNCNDEQNVWFAHCIQKSLLRATGVYDRGVRRARFAVLREAPCPAVLIEAGFLSSADEEKKLLAADYRDRLAKAIVEGILKYKAGVEQK
jgi:N-acetylmuramoyl-L-alanine amidase